MNNLDFKTNKSKQIEFNLDDSSLKTKDTYPKDSFFLNKALDTVASVRGYGMGSHRKRFYKLPDSVQNKLDLINKEVEEKRRGIVHNEESEESIYYAKARALVDKNNLNKSSIKDKIKRNLQIAFIVFFGCIGYYLYGENIRDLENNDISTIYELMEKTPMRIDNQTVLLTIKEKDDGFIVVMQKDRGIYDNVSIEKRDKSLDLIVSRIDLLCNNEIINKTVNSGKKITVVIDDLGKTYRREKTIEKCPILEQK